MNKPEGPGWIQENKFDGSRMQLNLAGDCATHLTRHGHDWTGKLGVLSVFAGELPDREASSRRVRFTWLHPSLEESDRLQNVVSQNAVSQDLVSQASRGLE